MSCFTNTGFVQVRIVVSLLVRFSWLLQLVVEIGHHLVVGIGTLVHPRRS